MYNLFPRDINFLIYEQLETNGYEVKGWAKGKSEESKLKDSTPDTFAVAERKRQLKLTAVLVGTFVVAYTTYQCFQYFFGGGPTVVLENLVRNVSNESVMGEAATVEAMPEVA